MALKQSADRQLVVAQQHCISTHSPVFALSQVGQDDLHSSVLLVKVSCDLVSLWFVVAPHGTYEDGYIRTHSGSQVPGLKRDIFFITLVFFNRILDLVGAP